MHLRPSLPPNTNMFLLWSRPIASSVLTAQVVWYLAYDLSAAELAPPALCCCDTGTGGEGDTQGHRKQLHQPCQNKQKRRAIFFSLMWKELHYLMGAAQERCQAHSSQRIRHLTLQTCGFSLSFPTPSRGHSGLSSVNIS